MNAVFNLSKFSELIFESSPMFIIATINQILIGFQNISTFYILQTV